MSEQLKLPATEIAQKYGIPTVIQRDPGGCAAWVAVEPDKLSDELKPHAYVNPLGMVQIPARVFREFAEQSEPPSQFPNQKNNEVVVFSRQTPIAEK